MKEYKPERMLAISRYQNYFPTLPEEIRNDIYQRMEALIEEEKGFCDKGNYKHMAQILNSIAMYEVLQQYGKTEEEAYMIVSEEMWKFLDPSGMQKMVKKSFFLPLMKKIVPFGFKQGSGFGWRYTWHKDDPKDEFHFECKTHERIDISYRSKSVLLTKGFGVLIFTVILLACALIAGAKTFWQGFWLSFGLMAWIGIYDTCFLDWVLFANLPMFRLEGTEHMDAAYHQKWFHAKGMLFPGIIFALIPATLVGLLVLWIR